MSRLPASPPTAQKMDACLKSASRDSTQRLIEELHAYNPTLYPEDRIKNYTRDN